MTVYTHKTYVPLYKEAGLCDMFGCVLSMNETKEAVKVGCLHPQGRSPTRFLKLPTYFVDSPIKRVD